MQAVTPAAVSEVVVLNVMTTAIAASREEPINSTKARQNISGIVSRTRR